MWSLAQGAETWEGPVRVNDTPTTDRTAQYLPKLAVAPDGRLDVVYFDCRADRANVMNEVLLQSSFDEGESFCRGRGWPSGASGRGSANGSERGMPDLGSRLGSSRAIPGRKQDLGRAAVAFSDPPRSRKRSSGC